MNKHILTVIDNQLNPGKYTTGELHKNAYAVADAYSAASYVAAYATYDEDANVTYWLNEYFKLSGENKQDYIDAINKDNKQ